jgi:hypothetical protein
MPEKPDKGGARELKVEQRMEEERERRLQELYEWWPEPEKEWSEQEVKDWRPETNEEKERRLMKAEDKVTPGGIRTREP